MYNGDVVSILFNKGDIKADITADFKTIEYNHETAFVRDLYLKVDLGSFTNNFTATVDPYSVKVVRLS